MTYRILTVCLGNICRSPAAEAVIRGKAMQAGLAVEVDSAGTAAYHVGDSPHTQSAQAGARRGYNVTGRGRQLRIEDFEAFDLIVTMDDSNLENVLRLAPPGHHARVVPLLDFAGGGEVPDPWGKPDSAYERMYDLIEEAAVGLVDELVDDQASGLRHDSAN
ncbi:MAG: low molecular weight protein-tyrosine-phosphatase [Acidimicrobiia bacterium]